LLQRLLRDVTLSAVSELIVPDVHELSGPKKPRFALFSTRNRLCPVLYMSDLIPRKAVPGSRAASLTSEARIVVRFGRLSQTA